MTTWRAFVGEWLSTPGVPYRTSIDRCGVSWSAGRDALLRFARDAQADNAGGDSCGHCHNAAVRCVRELEALPVGAQWSGDIDRDELWLMPEEAP